MSAAAHQTIFAALGLPAAELEAVASGALGSSGTASLGTIAQPGGDPLVGLSYHLDHCAEEEWGAGRLCLAITGQERRYRMADSARSQVAIVDGACALVLSTEPIEGGRFCWGDRLPGGGGDDYARRYDQLLDITRGLDLRGTVPQLRQMARRLGIPTSGLRKHQLQSRIRSHPEAASIAARPERWPAWFGDGQTLVLRADSGPCAVVLERLRRAAEAGALAITTYQVPFGGGLFVYDARDETPELVAERQARWDWHEARMTELEPVAAELRRRGHSWFFLGRPSEMTREGVTAVRYWLNGTGRMPGRGWGPQPFGWYTLDELLSEKFLADAEQRVRSRSAA